MPARSSVDAHRALPSQDKFDTVLTWQEQRIVSKNLSVQFDRVVYQIQTERLSYALRKAGITVCRDAQHKVTLLYKGQTLSYNVFHQQAKQSEVVLSKDLNQSIPRQPVKPALIILGEIMRNPGNTNLLPPCWMGTLLLGANRTFSEYRYM